MTLSYYETAAHIDENGKLVLQEPDAFKRQMQRFGRGLAVTVRVEERKDKRSSAMNRFYWGVVIAVTADELGYTKDEMHEAWKMKFLRKEDPDHPLPTCRSTTGLSTQEMQQYIEAIRVFAASELNCQIPEPNEGWEAA